MLVSIISLLIAITIHEYSHSLAADRLGDPTPRSLGRLSLNPLRHLDPIGTLFLFIAGFGWGKPVPIDPYNFRQPRRDELLVALAGPGSNIILALLFAIAYRLFPSPDLFLYFYSFIFTNLALAFFNLLPIPPLDGSQVFLNLLSPDQSHQWRQALSRYGYLILFLLLFIRVGSSSLLNLIIYLPTRFFLSLFLGQYLPSFI